MTDIIPQGNPEAGYPYVRFDMGEVELEKPRRGSLFNCSVLFVVVSCALSVQAEQNWSYENSLLTGADGMVLKATLSGEEVKVTGVSDAKGLTTIDLRGPVTGPNGEEYAIVEATNIKIANLKELYLPDTLRKLGSFDGCSTLEKVEPLLPASLTEVAAQIFRSCSKLTGDVRISNPGFKNLARCAFQGTAITSVDFTDCGIEYIADWAFASCSSLTNVTPFLPDSVYCIDNSIFNGCSKLVGDVKLNNANLKSIPEKAFYGTMITSIDFGISPLESIGSMAFDGVTTLTNVTPFLPPTVKYLGASAAAATFRKVKVPKVLHLNSPDLKEIPASCFQSAAITGLDLEGCGVTNINGYAFEFCSAMTNVVPFLPATVQTVGQGAFKNCAITNALKMSCKKADTIAEKAFYYTPITSVDLGESKIRRVDTEAFRNCSAKKVVLPASLVYMGNGALRGNSASEGFWFCGPKPEIAAGNTAFFTGGAACSGALFFPKGDATWEEYIYDVDQNTVADLTAAEKAAFAKKFESVSYQPSQKVTMQKNGQPQYLCWWNPITPGLIVIMR